MSKRKRPDFSYLGEELVWEFHDDVERADYTRTRKRGPYSYVAMALLLPLAALLLFVSVARFTLGIVTIGVVWSAWAQVYRWYIDRKHGLTALRVRFLPRQLMITEQYGEINWMRDRQLGVLKAKHVVSAVWVTDGCLITMNRWFSSVKRALLHRGLFTSTESLKALQEWAEQHGIEIEGVPPLPGGYLRPIEERRGI